MNTVDISFSEFGRPIKVIIVDPKKYKSKFSHGQTKSLVHQKPQRNNNNSCPFRIRYPSLQVQNNKTSTNNGVDCTYLKTQSTPHVLTSAINNTHNHIRKQTPVLRTTIEENDNNTIEIIDDENEEEDDEQIQNFLSTEQITRVGRLCKKPRLFNAEDESTKSSLTALPAKEKGRKRIPPDIFRCKTCFKYYVGYKRLGEHFKKYPDHQVQENQQSGLVNSCSSIGVQVDDSDFFQPPPTSLFQPLQIETESSQLSLMGTDRSPSPKQRRLNPITVPLTSRNVLSPSENSLSAAMSTFNEDDFELRFRKTTQQEAVAGPIVVTGVFSSLPKSITKTTTVNSRAIEPICSPSVSPIPPIAVSQVSRMTSTPSPDGDTSQGLPPTNTSEAGRSKHGKSVWDFMEEKLFHEGINQILTEISDVADKLSKIARDKIIPIREEEEERLQSSVPIIHVDTPFLSHLLDLPFGTYIFKDDDEDVERRQPSAAELSQLSLTSVPAEVDIEKFLSQDSVLPHLTNLDFNSICNQ